METSLTLHEEYFHLFNLEPHTAPPTTSVMPSYLLALAFISNLADSRIILRQTCEHACEAMPCHEVLRGGKTHSKQVGRHRSLGWRSSCIRRRKLGTGTHSSLLPGCGCSVTSHLKLTVPPLIFSSLSGLCQGFVIATKQVITMLPAVVWIEWLPQAVCLNAWSSVYQLFGKE